MPKAISLSLCVLCTVEWIILELPCFPPYFIRSVSPNLSNRSSPLAFINHTGSVDYPDPFANGADIQISNIDYRLSRKELQQTLQEIFSKHGKVNRVYFHFPCFRFCGCSSRAETLVPHCRSFQSGSHVKTNWQKHRSGWTTTIVPPVLNGYSAGFIVYREPELCSVGEGSWGWLCRWFCTYTRIICQSWYLCTDLISYFR